jgi:hypothetical protein
MRYLLDLGDERPLAKAREVVAGHDEIDCVVTPALLACAESYAIEVRPVFRQ